MATIVLTSASSLRAHHQHGAVNWAVVRSMTPGLIAGGFAGSWLARYIPTVPLAIVFAVFVCYSATQIGARAHRSASGLCVSACVCRARCSERPDGAGRSASRAPLGGHALASGVCRDDVRDDDQTGGGVAVGVCTVPERRAVRAVSEAPLACGHNRARVFCEHLLGRQRLMAPDSSVAGGPSRQPWTCIDPTRAGVQRPWLHPARLHPHGYTRRETPPNTARPPSGW